MTCQTAGRLPWPFGGCGTYQNGNLVQTTDEQGLVTMYSHDPRNLIEAINYDNGKSVNFGYNKAGELVLMEDWNGATEFELDLLGQITSVNDHGLNETSYRYDAAGNQDQITYPDGSVASCEFDLLDRMTRLTDNENQAVAYSWDAARLTGTAYPNGWAESYAYNANGWLTGQSATDPTNTPSKTVAHGYMYDFNGNVVRETRSGSGGQDKYDLTHSYDALGRLTLTTGLWGYKDHEYVYDSLGNLVRERIHNKWTDYSYNALNQQVGKLADGKDAYVNTFDARGNFVKSVYEKNKNQSIVVEQYEYDATNRMVKGTNEDGEQSHYIYNGFGDLVANEWVIAKNAYGYTGVNAAPKEQVGGVVACDRHQHTTGQGHINPTGNGHTTGGTLGATTPSINSKQAVVHKDYALDYTDPLRRVLMESEGGAGGLTYRYVYGLEKVEVAIFGIPNGAGSVTQYAYDVGNGGAVFTATHPGNNVAVSSMVKLWHHKDRLGSTDYLTDNVAGKVTSYVTYDDWGALTAKAVLKVGVRELDLVQEYTGHPYDMVLGIYYAKARMYDAGDRRFMAVDPVKGTVADPHTMVQYLYCLDNPILYVDPFGLEIDRVLGTWEKAPYSQYKPVYDNLLKIIKKQYALGMFASSRLTHALTAIIDYKTYISSIASTYTMEPAMIAAIIVKEQVTQSAPDEALYLDTAARGTAHSFGLGAIFPITAVEAWTAMSAEDSDIMQKFYIYTSGLPSGALSDIGSINIYVGAMLMSNDKFNIETIAVVLSHNYNLFKDNYSTYEAKYYALFGCDYMYEDNYLVNDINAGFTDKIYGHLLSMYNTGSDYIKTKDGKNQNNDSGIKYANYTREYLPELRKIFMV